MYETEKEKNTFLKLKNHFLKQKGKQILKFQDIQM